MKISPQAQQAVREWRQRLHRHPELGYAEHETARAIAAYLENLGWRVETGLAGTGVLARLPGTRSAPRVLLRTELDALPIQDETGLPFSSAVPGVSHACGHDAHMAILIGVATTLSLGQLGHGEVGLVFQPAEELLGGGRRIIEEGLWRRFDPDCCFALHGWPALPEGVCGLVAGPCMAAFDNCRIRVVGRPGHGAMPHETVDPVVVASELVLSLQTVLSRNLNPLEPAVLTFGRITGGTAHNAVAAEVALEGTIRYFDEGIGRTLANCIRARAGGVAAAHGATAEVEIEEGYPATVNQPGVVRWLEGILTKEFGPESVRAMAPVMGSEDFSYYLRERPGAMLFLGAGGDYPLHHPRYSFPDELLCRGVELYLAIIAAVSLDSNLPWR